MLLISNNIAIALISYLDDIRPSVACIIRFEVALSNSNSFPIYRILVFIYIQNHETVTERFLDLLKEIRSVLMN